VDPLIRTRIRRGALSVAAAIAVSGAACSGESPTDPGEPYPYDLVFERREGTSGSPDLYYLDLQSGEATRLLAAGVFGMHPAGSPVGSQIAFVRMDNEFNSEVFTANYPGGTGSTNLSNHAETDVMPTWSPNGQRLAFVTDRAGFQDIFVINANGTNPRRITPEDPFPAVTTEWWPAWSPDGTRIAYSSTIDGTADIWTTTVDATPVLRERLTGTSDADFHPTWSPEGDRIAFHRIDQNTGEADIMILDLNTHTARRISMPGQQLWPAWSPQGDGDLIAFSSDHEGTSFEIYTMTPEGADVTRRTQNALNDLRPTWVIRPVND
jgi:Tol biopolymer transport system component